MKILVIQTSFLGDVVLATAVIEKLHHFFPAAHIDMLVRKGNESLLTAHPFLSNILTWDKKDKKYSNLFKTAFAIRRCKYDLVINLHRFASSGIITALSGAKDTRGFRKNPLSSFFHKVFPHVIGDGTTEYQRNQKLIADITDDFPAKPKLYPSTVDHEIVNQLTIINEPLTDHYICIAPASVWFTKQFPAEKWSELIKHIPTKYKIFLIGSKEDQIYAEQVRSLSASGKVKNLCGQLTLLQSAALMEKATMNYVNDSAALHIASAMNAPVTAFFLSTVPRFGFIPTSDHSQIIETEIKLDCKPCGLHGHQQCPKGHFKCALTIDISKVPTPKLVQ